MYLKTLYGLKGTT